MKFFIISICLVAFLQVKASEEETSPSSVSLGVLSSADDPNSQNTQCSAKTLNSAKLGLFVRSKIDEGLKVTLDKEQRDVDDLDVECFFQLNVDVTDLEISFPNLRILSLVSKSLPNLESLILLNQPKDSEYFLNYKGEEVHFRTVKRLLLTNDVNQAEIMLEGLVFDNLESLTLDIGYQEADNWIAFLHEQNNNLKSFTLYIEGLTKEHLLWIPKELHTLKAVNIVDNTLSTIPPTQFEADDIATFIEQNEFLNRLKIHVKMTTTDEWDKLRKLLEEKWSVVVYNMNKDPLSKAIKISKKN